MLRNYIDDENNPFSNPKKWRNKIIRNIYIPSNLKFSHRGFICVLITSRCPINCEHCMFSSNMYEKKTTMNTMGLNRVDKLMKLTKDSNTGYLLISGGGEGFLELELMYKIIQESSADITWMVTSGFWGLNRKKTQEIIHNCYKYFKKGNINNPKREIFIRISFDKYHLNKIDKNNKFDYIINIIEEFDNLVDRDTNFNLMIHSIEGDEELIKKLALNLNGELIKNSDDIHSKIKITQKSENLKLSSGLIIPITFAKLLQSDIAVDLRNHQLISQNISIWEKDAYINERNLTGLHYSKDENHYGNDMLVIYDGRIAGGWQCEMPDIPINIDNNDYQSIMDLTLSDPGTLATLEKGQKYRFCIINEINTKACIRARAINIRDYTSLTLLEEDKVKLYYTIRAIQDFYLDNRIKKMNKNIEKIINLKRDELISLYNESKYDIIKQFKKNQENFILFEEAIFNYKKNKDKKLLVSSIISASKNNYKLIDQWRLLILRIFHNWYDISSWEENFISTLKPIVEIMDSEILKGKHLFDGLSTESLR